MRNSESTTLQSKKAVSSILYSSGWKLLALALAWWRPEILLQNPEAAILLLGAASLIEVLHIGGQATIDTIIRGLDRVVLLRFGAPTGEAAARLQQLRQADAAAAQVAAAQTAAVELAARAEAPVDGEPGAEPGGREKK